ncbi:hypothetical protein AAVH_02663 [Aphelenchoides avenae]|nr:hypothetical protein AAVH_02663 [Aphelenchus avenae]
MDDLDDWMYGECSKDVKDVVLQSTSSSSAKAAKSSKLGGEASELELDYESLGRASYQHLRETKPSLVADATTGALSEKQKEQYARNMYSLIVTARRQLKEANDRIQLLEKRLKSSSVIRCPNCEKRFSSDECERCALKPYPRIFAGKKTVELKFRDLDEMNDWLIHTGLDTDARGNPTWVREPPKTVTLTDVGSKLPALARSQSSKATITRHSSSSKP